VSAGAKPAPVPARPPSIVSARRREKGQVFPLVVSRRF
jgi:hypothetical protein